MRKHILYVTMAISVFALSIVTLPVFAISGLGVVASPTVGTAPLGVGINENTNLIYASNDGDTPGTVSVIDGNPSSGTYNTVVHTITTTGSFLGGVAANNGTNIIYVTSMPSSVPGSVYVIDGSTNTANPTPIPVGINPVGVAANDKTNLIYVTANGDTPGTVYVIDGNPSSGTYNTVVKTITVGTNPDGIAINRNTDMIYVANNFDNTVSVIDGSSNTVVHTISLSTISSTPFGIAVNDLTNKIYVTDTANNLVFVIDGSTNTVNPTPIPVGIVPLGIAVNDITNTVFVTNTNDNVFSCGCDGTVTVIDGSTNTVVNTLGVGISPFGIAANDNTNTAYAANTGGTTVSIIALTPTPPSPTTTALSSSATTISSVQPVTFTATVSPSLPDGETVQFYDGTTLLGIGTTTGSVATFTASGGTLSVGHNLITARYVGNPSFNPSPFSNIVTVTVTQSTGLTPTTTTLLPSTSSTTLGQPVTFTAIVSPAVPDGETVTFLDGITPIGTGTTTGGVATFTTSALSAGPHSITASYPGDSSNSASTSSAVTITVNTLLGQKQDVITSLQSLTAVNKDDKKDLTRAIEEVKDSVKPSLWQTDGIHLVVKKGDKVFEEEKQAVQQLRNIIEDKKESASFVTTLKNDIDQLVGADKGLAQTAINDATTTHPDKDWASDLADAKKEFTKASTSTNPSKAIDHYKNAWSQATEANTDNGNGDHGDDQADDDHSHDGNDNQSHDGDHNGNDGKHGNPLKEIENEIKQNDKGHHHDHK